MFLIVADIEIFGVGLGGTYYASNDMDPYLNNQDVSLTHLGSIIGFIFLFLALFFCNFVLLWSWFVIVLLVLGL